MREPAMTAVTRGACPNGPHTRVGKGFLSPEGIRDNTTYLGRAGSHNAVTWVFVLVWRRGGTPGRRWVSNPRLSQESLVQSCLRSAADAIGPAEVPVAGTPAGTVVVRAADLDRKSGG